REQEREQAERLAGEQSAAAHRRHQEALERRLFALPLPGAPERQHRRERDAQPDHPGGDQRARRGSRVERERRHHDHEQREKAAGDDHLPRADLDAEILAEHQRGLSRPTRSAALAAGRWHPSRLLEGGHGADGTPDPSRCGIAPRGPRSAGPRRARAHSTRGVFGVARSPLRPYHAAHDTGPLEHTYGCSEDTVWNQVFLGEDYNRRLYLEGLRFHEWREIERQDQGEALRRTVEVVPRIGDLPGPLKKVVGDGIRYKEIGNYDKNRRRYRIEVVPSSLADKLSVTGELFTEPLGEARCRRVFQGDVTAKIFGIGGMLEKRLIEDMQKSYARGAEFTNGYIREKGLA